MPGWGTYQKPKKSQAELDLERRRELGLKFYSDIDELVEIAAKGPSQGQGAAGHSVRTKSQSPVTPRPR